MSPSLGIVTHTLTYECERSEHILNDSKHQKVLQRCSDGDYGDCVSNDT